MTTNAVRRRDRRWRDKLAKGSRNVPIQELHVHHGICVRCERSGLVNADGVCTGTRATTGPPYYELRSKRCDAIVENRIDRGWSVDTAVAD